jgi:hypothetical protein
MIDLAKASHLSLRKKSRNKENTQEILLSI